MEYMHMALFGKTSWFHPLLGIIVGDSKGFQMNPEPFLLYSPTSHL